MVSLLAVALYTDYACNGGVLLGFLPVATRPGACVVTESIEGVLAAKKLKLTVSTEGGQADLLEEDLVLRLIYVKDSTATGAFDEYRIEQVEDGVGDLSGLKDIFALDPIYDLGRESEAISAQYTGTITSVLTNILNHAPAFVNIGTITPTVAVQKDFRGVMPLPALQEAAQDANDAADYANGERFELQLRRNGATDYKLDLIAVGGTAALPDIRQGKNLQNLRRRVSRKDKVTRLYVTAQGQPLWDVWFEVTAVTVNTYIEIQVPDAPDLNPLLADGAFTEQGLFWFHEDGTAHAITNDVRATQRLYMASTTGIAVGEWGRLTRDAAGNPVLYIDMPGTRPIVGALDVPYPPATNRLPNADFSAWQGTSPDVPEDWDDQLLIPTAGEWEQELTDTLFGSAAKAPNTGDVYILTPSWNGWSAGQKSVYLLAGDQVGYSLWFKSIDPLDPPIAAVVYWGDPNDGQAHGVNIGGTEPGAQTGGVWQSVHRSYTVQTSGTKTLWFFVLKNTNHEYLIGGAVLTVTPKGAVAPQGFFTGSPGARAWVRGINALIAHQEVATYEVGLLDLTRYDPATWSYDTLVLGGSLNFTARPLITDTLELRVVQVERDQREPIKSRIMLSNRWDTLTEHILGGGDTNIAGTQIIGTSVNLTPDEPIPPVPTQPAPNDGAFLLVGGAAGFPQGRGVALAGGMSSTDTGPGGTFTFRAPEFYTQATDPALDDPNDVADGDWWLLEDPADTVKVQRREGAAWVTKGWLVPDAGSEDEVLTWHADGYPYWAAAGAGSTIDVQEEGSPVGTFDTLNFIGTSVTATDGGGGVADITVTSGGGSGLTSYVAVIGVADDDDEDATTIVFEPVLFYPQEAGDTVEFPELDPDDGGEVTVTTGGRYLVTFNARSSGSTEGGSQIISAFAQCYAAPGVGIYGALAHVEDQETMLPEGYGAVLTASGEIRANAGDAIRCKLVIIRDNIGASNGWSDISLRVTRLGD